MSAAGPYARAAARRLGGLLLTLLLVPVALAFVFGVPALVALLVPLDGTGRTIAALIAFVGCVGLVLVLTLVVAMLRTGVLDPHFAALGLRGRSLVPNLREYAGQHGAFAAHAMYARRGGVLEIALEVPTEAKASFALAGSGVATLREFVGLGAPLASPDPALAGVALSGADPGWVAALAASPGVPQALHGLLRDPSGREVRVVAVRPGCVKVVRRWIDPDAAGPTLAADLAGLGALAEACRRLGPPALRMPEGAFERAMRRHPTLLAMGLVAAILAAILVPTLLLVAALILTSG